MSQHNWQRHQFLSFIARISKDHTLVAGAGFSKFVRSPFAPDFICGVNAALNIRALFINRRHNSAGISVKTKLRVIISNFIHCFADNAGDIHITVGRDFAHDKNHTGCRSSFARDTRKLVL